MKTVILGAVLAAYCAFWFAIALATGHQAGEPTWLPFAILALVAVPAALGISLGRALKEKRS